jgi:hypothetical protein
MRRIINLSLVFTLLCSCSTINYRNVQEDYNNAVRNEINSSVIPMSDYKVEYSWVINALTKENINSLDDRLKGNAYMLLAISHWRINEYKKAKEAVDNAEMVSKAASTNPALALGARDNIMLKILPSLIAESSKLSKYDKSKGLDEEQYSSFKTVYKLITKDLQKSFTDLNTGNPGAIKFYIAYQNWRVLQNWRIVISTLKTSQLRISSLKEVDEIMNGASEDFTNLKEAINFYSSKIPLDNPLRVLTVYQTLQ